jgi:cbb3-type cytochrome oxidase cytochrome c subunit
MAIWLLLAAAMTLAADDDDDEVPRRPGIVATWTDGSREVTRIEGRPAFFLAPDESPHPQISAESFSATWQGRLNVLRPGKYQFSADVQGEFVLWLGETEVLRSGTNDEPKRVTGPPSELKFGPAILRATFKRARGPENQPLHAELRLYWQRENDLLEPIPATAFDHSPEQETPALRASQQVETGRHLVMELRCTQCHALEANQPTIWDATIERVPLLSDLGSRVQRAWLYHWLDKPQAFRPHTSMPQLFNDSKEDRIDLYAATEFLVANGRPPMNTSEKTNAEVLELGARSFATLGCIACHTAPTENAIDELKNSAAKLSSLVPLTGLGSKSTPEGILRRIAEPSAHWPDTRMPDFKLREQQPEVLQALARYLAENRQPEFEVPAETPSALTAIERFETLVPDAIRRARFKKLNEVERWHALGQVVVQTRGCLNCHQLDKLKSLAPAAATWSTLQAKIQAKPAEPSGCLSEKPKQGIPAFQLTPDERTALAMFLAKATPTAKSPAPTYHAEWQLDRLGCTNCHQRNGHGGEFGQRITKFVPLGTDKTLLDVAPPDLSGIGEKLRPQALDRVIAGGVRSRPWMDLKMPVFAKEQVRNLSSQLAAADGLNPHGVETPSAAPSSEQLGIGRLLVGRTGLNCVSCHDIRGVKSSGVRGPDLAQVAERVRPEWFDHWLLEPQRITPGTRMPSVFFGGKSASPQYLQGDPKAQIAALWAYLSQGKKLELPIMAPAAGVVVEGGENPHFTPRERPMLVRGFMRDLAGTRALALGFPSRVHFAFDSDHCRLTHAWQGDFVEQGGWFGSGRGTPKEDGLQVLGKVFWRDEQAGFPLLLGHADRQPSPGELPTPAERVEYSACWSQPRDAGFAYRATYPTGVTLNVEDRPAPIANWSQPGFQRTLQIASVPKNRQIWWRISVPDSQENKPSVLFLDRQGHEISPPEPADGTGFLVQGVDDAPWLNVRSGETSSLISARNAPPHSSWVIVQPSIVPAAYRELAGVWLRLSSPQNAQSQTISLLQVPATTDRETIGKLEAILKEAKP